MEASPLRTPLRSTKGPRARRWTPHSRSKPYCTCRQPWGYRPMIQCEGLCQEWFHIDCLGLDDAASASASAAPSSTPKRQPYFCDKCRAKGDAWLREPTYCVCEQPWSNRFMLECTNCAAWFHGSCVGVSKRASLLLEAWHCAACAASAAAAAPPRAPLRARAPGAAELPALSADLWAYIVEFVPVTDRCRSVARASRKLLAAVEATLERWARRNRIAPPARSGRPSRFGPSSTVATLCPWLSAVQTHGCRCCLEAAGEFACRRDATIHAAALSTSSPLPKRFLLCTKCARREPLLVRLQLLGFDVATESLAGKPLFPQQFRCALGAAIGGVPDVA